MGKEGWMRREGMRWKGSMSERERNNWMRGEVPVMRDEMRIYRWMRVQ